MAFPTVAARTETALVTAGTAQTVNFTQTTGHLVVIFVATTVSTALSSISDSFTNLTGVTEKFHILYKQLAGTEGGNVTFTTTSTKSAAIAYNITGHISPATQAPQISTVASAASNFPDSSTVTPTGGAKDYLWITAFGSSGHEFLDDDTWCTTTPTSFTNLTLTTSGTAGAATVNCMAGSAERASNAASMDPAGSFTVVGAVWRAYTLAVHPVPAVPRIPTLVMARRQP